MRDLPERQRSVRAVFDYSCVFDKLKGDHSSEF
jgi:hypothetical protein